MDDAHSHQAGRSHIDDLANSTRDFVLLIARVLMSWIFIQSGFGKLMDIPGFVATMGRRGLPDALGYVAPFVEFFGGLALLFGLGTRHVALLMLAFTIIATFSSHAYWSYPVAQQAVQASNFWKNVTIMGGQVALFVAAAGRFSLDHLLRRKG